MSTDQMKFRPGVVPAVCGNGHTSYPYPVPLLLEGSGEATLRSPVKCGQCPACGAARAIPAGTYTADAEGVIKRAEHG